MTVNITIEGNHAYCDRAGLTQRHKVECYCTDRAYGVEPMSDCGNCKGTGDYMQSVYPFELNVANGNFATLWSALGLDSESEGAVDARKLRRAMVTVGADLVEREGSTEIGMRGARLIDMGITQQQAERYLTELAKICDEAERRESPIIWC